MPAPRRRPGRSPTTSPTTPTTSTTACAPSCSGSTISRELPLIGEILREIAASIRASNPAAACHELVRRLITRMIEDVIAREPAPDRRRSRRHPSTRCAMPARPVVGFSRGDGGGRPRHQGVPLSAHVSPRRASCGSWARPRSVVRRPVRALRRDARRHAGGMAAGLDARRRRGRARRIADFIAGMTDRFAMMEHARLSATPTARLGPLTPLRKVLR